MLQRNTRISAWVLLGLSIASGCVMSGDATSQGAAGDLIENLALAPPTLLSATAAAPSVETITWSEVTSPNLELYIVDRGTTPDNLGSLTSVSASRTSWTSTDLTPHTQYCWGVRDVTTSNEVSVRSNVICATTPGVLTTPPPANVHAVAISDTRITLTWDAVADATAYRVSFRVQGNDEFQPLTSVSAPNVSVVVAGLLSGTTYNFVVTTVTTAGESVPSSVSSTATFPAGLEGYWTFDERSGPTATDTSGYGRNATLATAGFATDRPPVGLLSNRSTLSISADPASQATIASPPSFRFAGATFALSAWVKLAGATDTDIIGVRSATCGALGWKLGQDVAHGLNISGGGGTRNFGTSLPAGAWTHVAFSFEQTAGQLVMYVNGRQVASTAYSPGNSITGTPLTIGHVGGCAGGAVLVDELRIFSRTLADSEVAALGSVPPAPTLTVVAPSAHLEILTWTAVANASRYFVYRGTGPGNESFLTSVAGSSLSFSAQPLAPLTQYSWFVRAEVGTLDSPASNEVVLSTPDVPGGFD